MKTKVINKMAVENFLSSMDMSLPEIAHQLNAMQDYDAYRWDSSTLKEIQKGITKAYKDKFTQNKAI